MTENNSCDRLDCKNRINKEAHKHTLMSYALPVVVAFGIADILLIMALYFFVTGSVRKSNSWSDSWDAYYCSQAVLPTSILVTIVSVIWLIAFCVLCFSYKE